MNKREVHDEGVVLTEEEDLYRPSTLLDYFLGFL